MPVHNADITAVLEEIADLLEIRGRIPSASAPPAARILGDLPQEPLVNAAAT